MFCTPFACVLALLAVNIPNLHSVIAQIILVILLQFFETCFGNIHKFYTTFH